MMFACSLRRSASIQSLEGRRLLAAGALDTSFSGDGIALANPPGGATFVAEDLCLQSDGKSVVVGNGNGARVTRYAVDGSTDTGFGSNGFTALPGLQVVRAVAMQGSSIIVVGDVDDNDGSTHVGAVRLTSGGVLDTSFGAGGRRVIDVPGDRSHAYDVAVQVDSKIVLVGSSFIGSTFADDDFIAVRLTSDGSVDTPFGGGDGVTEIDFTGGEDRAFSVAFDYTVPSTDPKFGSIFVSGMRSGDGVVIAVAKLTPAGLYDNSFDGNARLTTDIPGRVNSIAKDSLVQPGSKLVLTGMVQGTIIDPARNIVTVRYASNGALDPTFGSGGTGYVETDLGGTEAAAGIALSSAGGLIVSGQSDQRLTLLAFTPDGVLDPRFSNDGIAIYNQATIAAPNPFGDTPVGNVKLAVTGGSILPNHRILATGGQSAQTIRVVDITPVVNVITLDAEASENNTNTASFRVSRGAARPDSLRVFFGVGGSAIEPDDDRLTNNQDYNAVGMAFGNGFTTPNFVTIPAGADSVLVTITAVDDNLAEGDETATFTVQSNAGYAIGSPLANILIRDNEPPGTPFTVSKAFLYETLPQRATFTFSQNVGASLSISDFVFSSGLTTPAFSYNSTLNTATLSWANPIADGNYNVRVKASGVTNTAGVHLNADSINTFGVLAGDPNRDGVTNFDDLLVLAQNYGETGRTFSQGNIDYSVDGLVSFDDLLILAQRYGTSLAATAFFAPSHHAKKTTGRALPLEL